MLMVVNFRLAQPLFTGSGLFDRLVRCIYGGEGNSIEIEDQIKNIQSRA